MDFGQADDGKRASFLVDTKRRGQRRPPGGVSRFLRVPVEPRPETDSSLHRQGESARGQETSGRTGGGERTRLKIPRKKTGHDEAEKGNEETQVEEKRRVFEGAKGKSEVRFLKAVLILVSYGKSFSLDFSAPWSTGNGLSEKQIRKKSELPAQLYPRAPKCARLAFQRHLLDMVHEAWRPLIYPEKRSGGTFEPGAVHEKTPHLDPLFHC